MGLELLLAILPPCYWCVRYSAFFLLVDLVLLLAIRVYSASFLLVDLVFCLIAGIVQCSSASFLLMGLVCCLLAIGGIGLLPPCYWWDWSAASSLLVGLVFCFLFIGGFGLLPLAIGGSGHLVGLVFCLLCYWLDLIFRLLF